MAAKNFTPVNNLIKKYQLKTFSQPKEAEPAVVKPEAFEIKEAVESKVEKELKPFISSRAETIKLPPDLKKIGVQSTPTTIFPNYQNIKLPLSDEKIVVGLHAPITSSLRWLATLAVYLLKMAHLQLKIVHGHVVRIIRR